MKINSLRASTYGTFKDCPFKYFLTYSLGLDGGKNFKAEKGTVVHHVLEVLAKSKKTGHYLLEDKYSNPEYLLDICFERYAKKSPEFNWNTKDKEFCRKQIYNVLDSRENPLESDIFKTEHQFEIEFRKPGFKCEDGSYFKLRGTVDLIIKIDEQTLEIRDYKTGERKDWITGKPKELEDFQKDMQLRIYDLALSILFPEFPNRMFTIIYTRDGGPFTVTFEDKHREETIDELRRTFNKIKTEEKPSRLIDDKMRSKEHWKCKYVCSFGKEKDEETGLSLCEKYHRIFRGSENIASAGEKIYNVSIAGKSLDKELSRRNDYSRANIHYKVFY